MPSHTGAPSPPGSLWKSRSQPRGGQQPTELWRPCTAGLYPSGAGFTCAFLQSKLVILCPCTRLYSSLAPLHSGYTLPCTGIYPSPLHWVIPCLYPALALGYTPLACVASPALSYKVRLPDRDAPGFFWRFRHTSICLINWSTHNKPEEQCDRIELDRHLNG